MLPSPHRPPVAPAELSVSTLTDISDLGRLRDEWEALLARSATDQPMLGPLWLLAWWRVFGGRDGRRLRAYVFRRAGRLVGLVPLLSRWHRHRGVLPMRRVELLGTGERQEDEIVSEYLAPIVERGWEEAVAAALCEAMLRDGPGWDEALLTALDGGAPAVTALSAALEARGLACERRTLTECLYVKLPGTWDAYVASLSKDSRYLVRRTERDFQAWAGDAWQVEIARTTADLARGVPVLHALHEGRWQASGQSGVFASRAFARFHDLVMPALLERDALDLRWLVVRGTPIAVSYSVIQGGRVFFYQGGRAMDVPKQIRPGIVLHLLAIKDAIKKGLREYDFLGGEARYKAQLANAGRPLIELRVARPTLAEAARGLLERGRDLAKRARAARQTEQTVA